jgi:peptidoglycan/LPS O-acetylase OafA/YrhL
MSVQQPRLSHPKYRPDIDGLRAVAVLAVVAFHAFPSWIKGGFIGVDVFFVISGYLISTIIFENLDRGTFSFTEFYARRIKRIFPALIIVLVACFIFGWFVLVGDEYKRLGAQVFAGSFFTSNFLFWRMAGYFDKWAYAKPLLNLWSLGIEEQFYIVWPLVLWLGFKRRYNLLSISVVIGSASFFLNIYQVDVNSVADFYSPLTRFWELMSGGILAWVKLYKSNLLDNKLIKKDLILSTFSFFGFALIIFGFFYINDGMGFPGVWALIPVFGSALIIYSGPKALVNRLILSNSIAVWFGLISFPLYLWHWPLLSFARILHSQYLSVGIRIFCIFSSIVLAWVTYKFIELPIRRVKVSRYVLIKLVILITLIGFAGAYSYYKNGFLDREVASSIGSSKEALGVELLSSCGLTSESLKLIPVCQQDSRSPIKYALLGDSKASAMWRGLVKTSDSSGRWLFIGGSCSGRPNRNRFSTAGIASSPLVPATNPAQFRWSICFEIHSHPKA